MFLEVLVICLEFYFKQSTESKTNLRKSLLTNCHSFRKARGSVPFSWSCRFIANFCSNGVWCSRKRTIKVLNELEASLVYGLFNCAVILNIHCTVLFYRIYIWLQHLSTYRMISFYIDCYKCDYCIIWIEVTVLTYGEALDYVYFVKCKKMYQ